MIWRHSPKFALAFTRPGSGSDSGRKSSLPRYAPRTVILFAVRVPVLSVQIVVAEPIVSQESSVFTRLFTADILFEENAKETVTASGRPSGTATAMTVRAVIK